MVSPKWQTMWVESQHCSKSLLNLPLPSLQAKRILEDLKTSCCSPNKAVQLEALKCWGLWIHNQSPDDWKLNTVCFAAVRPLITKKLQPLHRDVDICKLKLSLMWALLVKVQDMMDLEGPQYILEAFLQSCLTWLSSASDNKSDREVSFLIFQLLLALFDKSETLSGCDDIENFPPLSSSILHLKKVFHLLSDKFLSIFTHWRKVSDKSVFLKIWKHFLAHCESSHDHIPIPVWHKVFKLAGQVCSEKGEPVKERLAFLHSCATTLKSALSSSKFIDFGNLLTTPCEVLLKKLVELCSVECDESRDPQLFWHSKEICQALSDKSVAIGGYDLCMGVVDVLEEFCLRSLFWGVWCGLVYCCNALLKDTPRSHMTKIEMKFYRKLRGVAANFELDRKDLHEECIKEVEKHIGFLSISWPRPSHSGGMTSGEGFRREDAEAKEPMEVEGVGRVPAPQCASIGGSAKTAPALGLGQYAVVPFRGRKSVAAEKAKKLNFDLIKDVLKSLSVDCRKSLLGSVFSFRFVSTRSADCGEMGNSIGLKVEVGRKEEISVTVCCREAKGSPPKLLCTPEKRGRGAVCGAGGRSESEEVVSTPTTRSRKRAEEERRRAAEMQTRRKRKSFEILVQEIVRKNKERKTEKNSERKKTSDALKGRRKKKKGDRSMNEEKQKQKVSSLRLRNNKESDRKLRNSKKEEPRKDQKKKAKNSTKADGKLENYFKVLTKKSENTPKKEVKPSKAEKKTKKANERKCCESEKGKKQRREEIGWKQTSLKAMMNPKSRLEKVKQGTRTREKAAEVVEEKPKGRNGDRKVLSSSLAKMSPFKEVFHDHEYAKMKPEKVEPIGKVLTTKKERRAREKKLKEEREKLDLKRTTRPLILGKANRSEAKPVPAGQTLKEKKTERTGVENPAAVVPALPERSTSEKTKTEEVEVSKPAALKEFKMEECKETMETEVQVIPVLEETTAVVEKSEKPLSELNEEIIEVQATKTDVCLNENRGQVLEELTPERRSRKRVWMMESPKGSKRIKLEEEMGVDCLDEKLPLEITEKENLEKNQQEWVSPSKKDKGGVLGWGNGSPRGAVGGMSRALRIIGLVPESTMGRPWDASPRVEVLKCKKAPNVDRNSRASKMLALLLDNVVEADEVIKVEEGEIGSSIVVATTPNAKTLLSSLKSPKSIKKRRSIRFDDARNETVLYQTDTPPSQILEEKEKRKGAGPFEVALDLPNY